MDIDQTGDNACWETEKEGEVNTWYVEIFQGRSESWILMRYIEEVLSGAAFEAQDQVKAEKEEEENVPAPVKKRKGNINQLVGDILSRTGGSSQATPYKSTYMDEADMGMEGDMGMEVDDQPQETPVIEEPIIPDKKPSVLHMPRSISFAKPRSPPRPPVHHEAELVKSVNAGPQKLVRQGIFHGLKFSHLIARDADRLETVIIGRGGILISEEDRLHGQEVDYIVVRL